MGNESVVRVGLLHASGLMRDSLARVLQEAGFPVAPSSSDPRAFLAEVAAERPEVVLTELTGPVALVDVVGELSRSCPEVRVIVLSGAEEREVAERCFASGAAGLLDRASVEPGMVLETVRAVARGLRVFPASLMGAMFWSPAREQGTEHLRVLSAREREVLSYISGGADNLKIASYLQIAERTVKAHVSALYRKLGQENRTQLALLARQLGVRPPAGI